MAEMSKRPRSPTGSGEGEDGQRKAHHADSITMRCLLTSKDAGSIIGKGGVIIKQVREESGCRIQISEHVSPAQDRLLTATGNQDSVVRAFTLLCAKITEASPMIQTITIRLAIPNGQAGAIIGTKGTKIKEIRESSGAQIQFEKEALPGSTERCCSLTGSAQVVSNAIFLITALLAQSSASRTASVPFYPSPMGNPMGAMPPHAFQAPFQAPVQANPYSQGPPQAPYSAYPGAPQMPGMVMGGGTHQTIINVSNEHIGSLIGKGGVKINQIRQSSQAQIKVSDPNPSDPLRVVTISGTMEACQMATYLIQMRIAEEMGRAAAHGRS